MAASSSLSLLPLVGFYSVFIPNLPILHFLKIGSFCKHFHVHLIWHTACAWIILALMREECSGNTCSQNLGDGKLWRSSAKQWNGSKGLKNGSWTCFYVLTIWPHVAGRACGLLQLYYWWYCSCPQIIQVWQPASSWAHVTLEHEWHGVVCCLVICFSSARVLFPLPYVVSYDRLRAAKGNLSNSSWGSPQWSSGAGWSTMLVFAILKTLLEYMFRSPTE